jgi:hypothetical protein
MRTVLTCPRCGRKVAEPSAWSSAWRCDLHGEVLPVRSYSPSAEGLRGLLTGARVPAWLPWPLPAGWLVTGFAGAGDDPRGTRGCVVALSGPSPVGGLGEMLLVSEEPGVGLGAGTAGLTGPDPGAGFAAGPPEAVVRFSHHEIPLWQVERPDRAAYAGEVLAHWLWVVLWPASAGLLLAESLSLRDLRDPGQDMDPPFGARSPRLPE